MRIGRDLALRLSGLFVLAAVWQIAGHFYESPALPALSRVLETMYNCIRDGTIGRHAAASLSIIFCGIGAAAFFGFALGMLMFRYRAFHAAALPVAECVRGVPALTLFPLLIVLFGLGTFSRVFIIFWTAWPAIALSTTHSLDVDGSAVDAARTSGAGDWRIIYSIRIPMAAQGLIAGLRIGVGGGWISLMAAEMLGATRGLGFFLLWSAQSFQFERVYASIIAIAAIGGVMNGMLIVLQKEINRITGGNA